MFSLFPDWDANSASSALLECTWSFVCGCSRQGWEQQHLQIVSFKNTTKVSVRKKIQVVRAKMVLPYGDLIREVFSSNWSLNFQDGIPLTCSDTSNIMGGRHPMKKEFAMVPALQILRGWFFSLSLLWLLALPSNIIGLNMGPTINCGYFRK